MNLRYGLLPFLLILLGCSTPEPERSVRETVDLRVMNAAALRFTPQSGSRLADLLICTPAGGDEKAAALFMEKVSHLAYRVLWLRSDVPADAAAAGALLGAAAAKMAGPGKKGLMLFGEWPGACPGLADSTFQAVIWVTPASQVQACLAAAADSASHHPQFALIIPASEPVALAPEWRTWIRSAENLVWLATDRSPAALLASDLEPIVRRKAQMFFDRHLKGKR